MIVFLARVRQRRIHSQANRAVIPCEGDAVSGFKWKQRMPRMWDVWTAWRLAKELLLNGFANIAVQVRGHVSLAAVDHVILFEEDPPVVRVVWPVLYVAPAEPKELDPLAGLVDEKPANNAKPRRSGIKIIKPDAFLKTATADDIYALCDDEDEEDDAKDTRLVSHRCHLKLSNWAMGGGHICIINSDLGRWET